MKVFPKGFWKRCTWILARLGCKWEGKMMGPWWKVRMLAESPNCFLWVECPWVAKELGRAWGRGGRSEYSGRLECSDRSNCHSPCWVLILFYEASEMRCLFYCYNLSSSYGHREEGTVREMWRYTDNIWNSAKFISLQKFFSFTCPLTLPVTGSISFSPSFCQVVVALVFPCLLGRSLNQIPAIAFCLSMFGFFRVLHQRKFGGPRYYDQ